MLNTDDFVKRLEELMLHAGLSPSALADKVGVQRSGVSHLLAGRNKPGLDFILKTISVFPEVDLYWLLTGKGQLLRITDVSDAKNKPTSTPRLSPSAIERIVTFYKDGTFIEHNPR